MFLQSRAGHHQSAAIPVDQLQSIRFPGPEYEDGPCKRVFVQLILDQRRQAVTALAEVDRLGGHHDPNSVRGTAQARAIAAIRAADAPSSRRIVTPPTLISGRLAFLIEGSETGGSTMIAASSTASSGAGRTRLPGRAIVRQVERWSGYRTWSGCRTLRDRIDYRAWPKALRNDLCLHLVRPVPVNLTSRLPV